ncbi:MAG: hypothetical protein ABL929_00925 [Ferruginibacter sp.]|nr:hypothetical protein [Ferruginibacter sp.]
MVTLNPQYIQDTAGKKLVILAEKQFDTIMEELEELEDIKRYDKAKQKKQTSIDAEIAFNEIEEKSMYKIRIEKAVVKTLEKN